MQLFSFSQRLILFAISFLFLSTLHAQAYCVRKHEVSAYEKAGDKNEIYKIEKYTPLQGTGLTKHRFVEVTSFDGKTFWVRNSMVTTDFSCLAVSVDKSRMREGPGKEFPANDLAERGQVFKDLGGEDGWTMVENLDGGKAWLNLDHTWKPRSKLRMSFDAD